MGRTSTTIAVWQCDGCHKREEEAGDRVPSGWQWLKNVKPEGPGYYESPTDLAWLFCPRCWLRARGALHALREMTGDNVARAWRWRGNADLEIVGDTAQIEITGAELRELLRAEGAQG